MKELKRTCSDCGAIKTFTGETALDIIHAIDAISWHDMPGASDDLCSACAETQRMAEAEDAHTDALDDEPIDNL
jgi:hypothetical protein